MSEMCIWKTSSLSEHLLAFPKAMGRDYYAILGVDKNASQDPLPALRSCVVPIGVPVMFRRMTSKKRLLAVRVP